MNSGKGSMQAKRDKIFDVLLMLWRHADGRGIFSKLITQPLGKLDEKFRETFTKDKMEVPSSRNILLGRILPHPSALIFSRPNELSLIKWFFKISMNLLSLQWVGEGSPHSSSGIPLSTERWNKKRNEARRIYYNIKLHITEVYNFFFSPFALFSFCSHFNRMLHHEQRRWRRKIPPSKWVGRWNYFLLSIAILCCFLIKAWQCAFCVSWEIERERERSEEIF